MDYDNNNIFAKIIRKELSADIVGENENALAFKDISPRAPIHILIIPKKEYVNFHTFISQAKHQEISDLFKLTYSIIDKFELRDKGYRLITNCGQDGNQEVKHLHFHLLAGKNLGVMLN